jgi:hypothetical protein
MYAQVMVASSIATWVSSSPGIWKGKKWGFWIRVVMDVATLVGGSAYLFTLKIPEIQKVGPVDLITGVLTGLIPAAYCLLRVLGVLGPKPS